MTSAVSVTVVSQPSKAKAKPPRPIPAPSSIARLPLSLCRAKSPFFAFCIVHKRLRRNNVRTGLQYDFFKLKTSASTQGCSAAGGSLFPETWPKLCWSPRQWCRGGWYWGFEPSGECSCRKIALVSTGRICRQALQQALQPDGTYPNSSTSTCVE